MSKQQEKALDELQEAALLAGDMDVIRKRLFEMGYRPALLLKGAHDVIQWNCAAGGKGINCQHVWKATPLEAISEDGGCPHCRLEKHILNEPAEEVQEAVLIAAINKQRSAISKSLKRSRKKLLSSSGNVYGLDRYM